MEKISAPWGDKEKQAWLSEQIIKRSYIKDVVSKIESLTNHLEVIQYGALSYAPEKYPLFILKNKSFDPFKKNIFITGGVHGYETSGVHGALDFLKTETQKYSAQFNIMCAPCISPWGYETINRWNPNTVDPNRSFCEDSPAEECSLLMKALQDIRLNVFAHIDLHETTDTDNSVFRPALEKRDGVKQEVWDIPDGFYLVGDSENSQDVFQKEIIDEVRKVTHIAPTDKEGKIIGKEISQEGVINYPIKKLNLCSGMTNAKYCTTTEVYPDSPKVTAEDCVRAQVAAVRGGLNFLAKS